MADTTATGPTHPRTLRGISSAVRGDKQPTADAGADGASSVARGLSIVVPLHNEHASLPRLHARLTDVARELRATRSLGCEVVYVDDGSRDDTLTIARGLPATTLDVQVISLSRNFGKEAALLAGLDHARLDAVLFIDGDGQHPTTLIERMVCHWLDDGYDVIYTAKGHRTNKSLPRRLGVKAFYLLLNWGAPPRSRKTPAISGCCRRARRAHCARCRSATASSRDFELDRLSSDPHRLPAGASRRRPQHLEDLRSLIGLSIDGLTGFSVAPLRFATMLGLLLALTAFLYGAEILYETWIYGAKIPGYPSLFVGLMVLGGVQLIMLGVVGEYIGKILYEIKGRPVYFVAEHAVKLREEAGRPESGTRTAAE